MYSCRFPEASNEERKRKNKININRSNKAIGSRGSHIARRELLAPLFTPESYICDGTRRMVVSIIFLPS